jgi:TPR repeat protein
MPHAVVVWAFSIWREWEMAEENLAKGFKWSKVAAEKGDADGMKQCATCYRFGNGVDQSNEQAIYWYEKFLELEENEDVCSDLQSLRDL